MSEQSGRPGRYQRSTGGLIGSMIVLLLAVGGFVVFREVFREPPRYDAEPVDYLSVVGSLQESGQHPAYPASLPDGWVVKQVDYEPGSDPVWSLAMDTADGRFIGLRQQAESAGDLARELIDEHAEKGDQVTIPTDLGELWTTWSDDAGDLGYSIELPEPTGQTVLVFGSASEEEQTELLRRLTAAPVA